MEITLCRIWLLVLLSIIVTGNFGQMKTIAGFLAWSARINLNWFGFKWNGLSVG
jgi:hypothetical protein